MYKAKIDRRAVSAGMLAVIGAIAVVALPAAANAGCATRHAYNTSGMSWIIRFNNASTCSIGPYTGSQCVVPNGQTAELHYDDTTLGPTNIILDMGAICDAKSKTAQMPCTFVKSYHYNLGECYLFHGSDTYPFVLNDPASGDVKIIGAPR
jgi:hypothetical protein